MTSTTLAERIAAMQNGEATPEEVAEVATAIAEAPKAVVKAVAESATKVERARNAEDGFRQVVTETAKDGRTKHVFEYTVHNPVNGKRIGSKSTLVSVIHPKDATPADVRATLANVDKALFSS